MKTYDPKLLGERIKKIRKARNLTQADLAAMTNLHPNTISKAEKGDENIKISTLDEIADKLSVSLFDLIRNDPIEDVHYVLHRRDKAEIKQGSRRKREPLSSIIGDLNINLNKGSLLAAVLEVGPKDEAPENGHPGEELFFCLTGQILVTIRSKKIVLSKGDAVLFWGEAPHSYRCIRKDNEKPSVGLSVIANSGYKSMSEIYNLHKQSIN